MGIEHFWGRRRKGRLAKLVFASTLLFGSQTCTNPFPFSFPPSPASQATKDFDAGDIRIPHKWRSYNKNNDSMQFCSGWRLYSSQGAKAFHGITRCCSKKTRLIFGNCWRGYLTRPRKNGKDLYKFGSQTKASRQTQVLPVVLYASAPKSVRCPFKRLYWASYLINHVYKYICKHPSLSGY